MTRILVMLSPYHVCPTCITSQALTAVIGIEDDTHCTPCPLSYRYSLMSSSLTADGVNTPRSVNSNVISDGDV